MRVNESAVCPVLVLAWTFGLAGCTASEPCRGLACCSEGESICKVGPGVSTCVDLRTDQESCGACWVGCGAGTCVAGACQCAPPPVKYCPPAVPPSEMTWAVAVCVDASTDPENCGDCDVRCAADEWCVAGACVRDDRCDGVVCRSTTVCGQVLPCERCVNGACEPFPWEFKECVPNCKFAASVCGLQLGCGITGGTCVPSYDCLSCCTGP